MLRHNVPFLLLCVFVGLFALSACNDGGSAPRDPVEIINIGGDDGMSGCAEPTFPSDQPNLFSLAPPRFPTDRPNGQAEVDPGFPFDAEVPVNEATRQVFVELRDGFSPDVLIYAAEASTSGNEIVELLLSPQTNRRGRYYMKITLCGRDCGAQEVVYDVNPDINSTYERTLIENGEVIRVDRTCVDLTADPGIGSGTIVIQ